MGGIAGAHAAWLFAPIEGQRISSQVLAPEAILEALAQLGRLGEKTFGELVIAEPAGAIRRRDPGCIDIALRLDQGDRALGQLAIGVEDGVVKSFQP